MRTENQTERNELVKLSLSMVEDLLHDLFKEEFLNKSQFQSYYDYKDYNFTNDVNILLNYNLGNNHTNKNIPNTLLLKCVIDKAIEELYRYLYHNIYFNYNYYINIGFVHKIEEIFNISDGDICTIQWNININKFNVDKISNI